MWIMEDTMLQKRTLKKKEKKGCHLNQMVKTQ